MSVYADLDGFCKKGFKKNYDGQKYFVGNGIVILARNEIFKKIQPRYSDHCCNKITSSIAPCKFTPFVVSLNNTLIAYPHFFCICPNGKL